MKMMSFRCKFLALRASNAVCATCTAKCAPSSVRAHALIYVHTRAHAYFLCQWSLPAYSRVHAYVSLDVVSTVFGARTIDRNSFEGACGVSTAFGFRLSMFVWNMRMRSATEFHRNNLLTISGIRVNSIPFGNRSHWARLSIDVHNRIQYNSSISKSIWIVSNVYHFLCWNNNNYKNVKWRNCGTRHHRATPHTFSKSKCSWRCDGKFLTFFRRFECVNVDSKLSNYVRPLFSAILHFSTDWLYMLTV